MAVEFVTLRAPAPRPGSAGTSPPLFDHEWVPSGYRGPVALPGTGRMVWWTGRIAIGLRYVPGRAS